MTDTPPPRFDWDWVTRWTLVFLTNLPIPLLFAWGSVSQGYGVGLFGAVAMLYVLGATVCGLRWRVGRSLCWGGGLVAATQVFPILHLFAGLFAVAVVESVAGSSTFSRGIASDEDDGWAWVKGIFEVCALVFLTAQPLLLLSLVIGAGIRAYRNDTPIWRNTPPDPDGIEKANRGPPNPFDVDDSPPPAEAE